MNETLSIGGNQFPTVAAVALGLMALELGYGWFRHSPVYDLRETAASLVIAVGNKLLRLATAGLIAFPLQWAWQHRLFDIPMKGPVAIVTLFLAVELAYYWHHVAMHRVRWFWATHRVHHSATRMNFSAAIRLGWGGDIAGGFLFYLPLAWLGFPPLAIGAALGLGLHYQFFLHTTLVPKLGPLEWLLNTPLHHCVHHAVNDACLDKNFGSTLIVYDRLFGTFAEAPRDEPLRFGCKGTDVPPHRPLAVVTAGWLDIGRRLHRATSWRAAAEAVFGRP